VRVALNRIFLNACAFIAGKLPALRSNRNGFAVFAPNFSQGVGNFADRYVILDAF
jgi:hypothetical protein